MDDAIMRRRVAAARVARLATVTPDGQPHVVPCCFALAGSTIYSAVDAKPKSTTALKRLANIDATPAAALLVDHWSEDWSELWWIRIDGAARVVTLAAERAEGLDALVDKYEQYRHLRPDGPLIAIEPAAWRGWP